MNERGCNVEREALALLERLLERPEPDRREWLHARSGVPSPVRARTEELLGSLERADDRLTTGGVARDAWIPDPPERIGAYRIEALVGQGGMGAVFRARRDRGDFEHEVAIKLIRPGALSEALVDRFERERQILASLSHPNIARLYDGGTTEEGGPFIVMEYLEGEPLTEWAHDNDVALDRRLEIMMEVCEAVGFAHQNLVIHRDLTPANVLVTADGTPKLIDFGIARPQDDDVSPDHDEARAGAMSLTPEFAAPERYDGAPATTLTDIYSLGRLLDRLTEESRNPELAAIVAKATDHDPDQRYPTAAALAEDIARFRDGYPVEAHRGGRSYFLRKFYRRNRDPVLAGILGLMLLLGALVGTGYAYNQAELERQHAQQRFAETRAIARTMMFDVYDEVSRVPGSTRARLLLADTAQRYLESLAADTSADADVRFDAALGYFRLAQVVGGRTGGGSFGRTARAQEHYRRSRALLESLHEEFPDRSDIQASLGQVIAVMADSALFSDGKFETAKANAVEARQLLLAIRDLDAASAGALGMTYLHQGNALAWEGEPEPAGETYRAGLRRLAELPARIRGAPPVRRARAELLRMLGAYHAYFRRPEEARRSLDRSLAIHRSIAERSGYSPHDIFNLVNVLNAAAQAHFTSGARGRAEALAAEAVELARRGMAASPDDVGPKEQFAQVAIFSARLIAARRRFDEAVALVDEAIAIKRSLLETSRDVVAGPMTLAVRLQEASEVYLAAGEDARACAIMREAVGIMRDYEETAELPVANRRENLEPMLAALRSC